MQFTGERFIPNGDLGSEISLEHMQRYLSIEDIVKNKIVLDAACGEGYGALILAKNAKQVYGIDISEEAINHASVSYKIDNLQFINNSIDNIELDDKSVDIVVSFETIEHVNENIQNDFLIEIKRVLKDDGMLIISTPDKYIYSDKYKYQNEFHVKEFYREEFYGFLNKYFKHIEFYNQDFKMVNVVKSTLKNSNNNLKVINLLNEQHDNHGKYIIAACSNVGFKEDYNIESIVFDTRNKYYELMDRIYELQEDVEYKSKWGQKLDKEIEKARNIINKQNERIEELSIWGNTLDEEVEKARNIIGKQNERIEELSKWGNTLDEEVEKERNIIGKQEEKNKELSNKVRRLERDNIQKNKVVQFKNGKIQELSKLKDELLKKIEINNDVISHNKDIIENFKIQMQKNEEIINELNENLKNLSNEKKEIELNIQYQNEALQNKETKILNLYNEMEEKNKIIIKYKDDIKMLKENNNNLDVSIKNKSNVILHNEKEIDNINKLIGELKAKNIEQEELINNQVCHIEQLLEKERILNNIHKSGGWRFLLKYYKVRDFMFPLNSKRRLFTKLLKNPIKILKHMNKESMRKFATHINEDGDQLEARINKYIDQREPIKKTEIEVFKEEEYLEKIVFKKERNPMVSIIIPVYNQFNYTCSCLKSILENTNNIEYEIIVGDDVSTDETINLNNYVENIKIIRNDQNLGFLLNCNNAAKYARGKYVLFLNNDTNVQKDWLKYLVELNESDEKIGMVGSKLVYPNGKLQEAGGILWNDASAWNFGRLDNPEKSEYNYVKEVDYISGASIMIRKDLWNEIGGFDQRYIPAYCEDSDFAFEVRKLGYKVMYQPKSIVVHFEGISNGVDTSSGIKKYQIENNKKFYDKWEKVLKKNHFNNAEDVFLARDRSKYSKTIVVIDHYVPNYDKDAGSRTTFQYLKMFIESGFNVKFIGDNFYRQEPYTTVLQQMGVEVLYGPWYAQNYRDWIKNNGKYIDYIYLNRPHISIKYIDFIKENTDAKIIYYGHDLHYLREKREYQLTGDKKLLTSSDKWKEIEFALMRKSDMTYYPSQVEIDEISRLDSRIKAKAIPAYIFETSVKKEVDFGDRKDLLFVGGFGHKPNVDAVLWFVHEVLPMIQKEIKNVKFYIVGSNPPEQVRKLEKENIIVTGFVSDEELQNYYDKCKLVVVPLRYGAGVKGKVVEAMYQQVPIVTTSVGAEGINNSDNVLIVADDKNDFAGNVIEYYYNITKLKEKSQNSFKYIDENYTKDSVLKIIGEDFK